MERGRRGGREEGREGGRREEGGRFEQSEGVRDQEFMLRGRERDGGGEHGGSPQLSSCS